MTKIRPYEFRVGDKIRILEMKGEPQYGGKTGVIERIDDMGQLLGTWGWLAVQRLMRHATIAITLDTYSHLMAEDLESGIGQLAKK